MEYLTQEQATKFFADFYGGEHHIPGFKPKQDGYGWSVKHDRGDLATYDFTGLTRLVLMGHEQCIRVSIEGVKNGVMKISIWQRQREGAMHERHPTIEDAISKFNSIQ